MPKLDEQISTLEERLSQLKLRHSRIEARQRAIAAVRERKADTRRRILLGGVVLEKMQQSDADRRLVLSWLDQTLRRSVDRALFGLEPLPESSPDTDGATG